MTHRSPALFPVQLRAVQRVMLARELLETVPAAVTLLLAGVAGFGVAGAGVGDRAIAAAEVASSAWMLLLLRHELRETLGRVRAREGAGRAADAPLEPLPTPDEQLAGVEWAGVAGAAMLGVEVLQHWRAAGRVQRPTLLLAAFTLYMAVGGRRVVARAMRRRLGSRRPRLALSTEGVEYRGSRRKRFVVHWDDVARVELDGGRLRLTLRDGRVHELRAADHVDGHRLLAAVAAALPAYLPPRLGGAPVSAT